MKGSRFSFLSKKKGINVLYISSSKEVILPIAIRENNRVYCFNVRNKLWYVGDILLTI